MPLSDDERRAAPRLEALVLVELGTGEVPGRHGITRDVSESGLLIASQSRFTPGERVELTIHGKNACFRCEARVVRVDETSRDEAWRYRIAVQLEEPVPPGIIEDGLDAAATLSPQGRSQPPGP